MDFFFVDINRTGTSSTRNSLDIQHRPRHEPAFLKKRRVGDVTWGNAYTFARVRNPFTKVVSQYKNRRVFHGGVSFGVWVKNRFRDMDRTGRPDTDYFARLWWPQVLWVTAPGSDRILVDDVLAFEDIGLNWDLITKRCGSDPETAPDLVHHNPTGDDRPWREFYRKHPGTAETIREYFEPDFDLFGYDPSPFE